MPARKNYHREALILLEHPEGLDREAMLWWIAKFQPSAFVHAARITRKRDNNGETVDREVLAHLKAGNLLAAIKRQREVTHMGLKEAKDYCDAIKASIFG